MKYRLVALDLDGTLLTSSKSVSPANASILRSLQERCKDLKIVISTGRSAPCISHIQAALDLPVPLDLICYNGACIVTHDAENQTQDAAENIPRTIPYSCFVPLDVVNSMLQFVDKHQLAMNFYPMQQDHVFVRCLTEQHSNWTQKYSSLTNAKFKFVESYDMLPTLETFKLLIFTHDPEELYQQVLRELEIIQRNSGATEKIAHVVRESFFIEILHPTVSKGTALKELCQLFGIDIQHTVAFGDGENDIEMLKTAGLGIAMANAIDMTKASAKKVSHLTNDEDAVAHELNLLVQEGKL